MIYIYIYRNQIGIASTYCVEVYANLAVANLRSHVLIPSSFFLLLLHPHHLVFSTLCDVSLLVPPPSTPLQLSRLACFLSPPFNRSIMNLLLSNY